MTNHYFINAYLHDLKTFPVKDGTHSYNSYETIDSEDKKSSDFYNHFNDISKKYVTSLRQNSQVFHVEFCSNLFISRN